MSRSKFLVTGEVVSFTSSKHEEFSTGTLTIKVSEEEEITFRLFEKESTPSRFQYIKKYLDSKSGGQFEKGDKVELYFTIKQVKESTYLNVASIFNIVRLNPIKRNG